MHHDDFPVVYIILLIFVLVPCFTMALLTFIFSIIAAGGWRRLSKQFASPRGVIGNTTYRVTGKVGSSTYKQGLKITTTGSGLGIEVSPLMFIGHTPLFIPFSAMHDPEKTTLLRYKDYISISVGRPEIAKLRLPASLFKGSPFERAA